MSQPKGLWSQPIRVEQPEMACLCTARFINSAIWIVNNAKLEERILGYLAKYVEKHGVILHAFVLMGNHYHMVARFPLANRSAFFKDFNARLAESVRELVPEFIGGPLLERRFTPQVLPLDSDVENYLLYCALQPVHHGLTERFSEYPSYNSFSDATAGKSRDLELLNQAKYNAARRRVGAKAKIKDFTTVYTLTYTRLPGYEHLSANEYKALMLSKIEQRRVEILKERRKEGKGFLGAKLVKKTRPGTLPRRTKKGGMRPLILTSCAEIRSEFVSWYVKVVGWYRAASQRYLAGERDVEFPPGTYKPPGPFVALEPT